jgi:hypothetical protein
MSNNNRTIAHRLGVCENAIRKLVGPSKSADIAQPTFAGITTATAEKPPATHVPSATLISDDVDHATPPADDDVDRVAPSADDRAGNADPIAAPADDSEPVPSADRTFDRQHSPIWGRSMMLLRSFARVLGSWCRRPPRSPVRDRERAISDQPQALR